MKREDIDKRIGMPDVDAEWAQFEREVIGKERPKGRLVAAWAACAGIAAAIAFLLVLNMGKGGSAGLPVVAQQTEEQSIVAQLTEEEPLVAQLTEEQEHPLHTEESTPVQATTHTEPTGGQAETIPATPKTEEDKVFACGEIMPRYPGGDKALVKFINENLRYPELALKYGAKGRVIMSLVVDSVGEVSDFKVMRSLLSCDTLRLQKESMARQEEIGRLIVEQMQEEALRVVSLLRQQPRWSPGEQFGRRVNVKFYIPVRFQPTEEMIATYESDSIMA